MLIVSECLLHTSQETSGKSQKTSLRQQARGADHQPDRPGRHLRGDRHLVEPGSPVAHQQLAELLTRQLRRKGEISSQASMFQPARCTKAQAESGDRSGGNPAPDAPLVRKGSKCLIQAHVLILPKVCKISISLERL